MKAFITHDQRSLRDKPLSPRLTLLARIRRSSLKTADQAPKSP